VKLFDKYSLYWSMLPFCVELVAVADPILVHAGSPCGQQLAAWEAELNGQSAIDPMRFDVALAAIRLAKDPQPMAVAVHVSFMNGGGTDF